MWAAVIHRAAYIMMLASPPSATSPPSKLYTEMEFLSSKIKNINPCCTKGWKCPYIFVHTIFFEIVFISLISWGGGGSLKKLENRGNIYFFVQKRKCFKT